LSTVETTTNRLPRILFVTGRLAEFALRQVLDELAPRAGFTPEVAVLPISVAALMTPRWVARHLEVSTGVDRIILPGHCRGDLTSILEKVCGVPVELGPEDLRDLPRYFGQAHPQDQGYGAYDIEILAEIDHYELMKAKTALTLGKAYRQDQSLQWGFLTEPEESHLARRRHRAREQGNSQIGEPGNAEAVHTDAVSGLEEENETRA